jgi:hypothetical protein
VASPLIGELIITGPRSGMFNSMWYLLGAGTDGLTHTILLVGVNKGEFRYVGEGRMEGTHNIAFYLPGTFGTDAYGFPLPGQDPVAPPLVFTTKDARLAAP